MNAGVNAPVLAASAVVKFLRRSLRALLFVDKREPDEPGYDTTGRLNQPPERDQLHVRRRIGSMVELAG